MIQKFIYLTEEEEFDQGTEFSVVFYLPNRVQENDDSMEEDSTLVEVRVFATSMREAVKYCEQYIRKMQHDDESWDNAEIQSIEQK